MYVLFLIMASLNCLTMDLMALSVVSGIFSLTALTQSQVALLSHISLLTLERLNVLVAALAFVAGVPLLVLTTLQLYHIGHNTTTNESFHLSRYRYLALSPTSAPSRLQLQSQSQPLPLQDSAVVLKTDSLSTTTSPTASSFWSTSRHHALDGGVRWNCYQFVTRTRGIEDDDLDGRMADKDTTVERRNSRSVFKKI